MNSRNSPKVSVIMPSLNVAQYIDECINSVINQTLKDIEIICVDAGSEDGTLEKLESYSQNDNRIRLIKSDKKSYGYQVNLGIRNAKGEYVGIVETDDYIEENMYELLYNCAINNNCEIVKADFCRFVDSEEEGRIFSEARIASKISYYNTVLNPQTNPELLLEAFYTWAGIYNREYLLNNNIFHNESPGASYQDNGFYFQSMACAERVYLLENNLYRLRRDNPNSSINNKEKVDVIFDEYDFIYDFLCKNEDRYWRFLGAYWANRFNAFMFTLKRIAPKFRYYFLQRVKNELTDVLLWGDINLDLLTKKNLNKFRDIVNDFESVYFADYYSNEIIPESLEDDPNDIYYILYKKELYDKLKYRTQYNNLKKKYSSSESKIMYVVGKIKGGIKCLKDNGLRYTIKRIIFKTKRLIRGGKSI